MNAIEVINLNPTTKEQSVLFAGKLIAEVESGEVNALDLHIKLTAMQKAIDDVKKKISEYALSEAEKYGTKSFEHLQARVDIQEVGTKYQYQECGDIEWEQYDSQILALTERKKEREKFLRTLTKPLQMVTDDGEGVIVNPPSKTSSTGVKITLL